MVVSSSVTRTEILSPKGISQSPGQGAIKNIDSCSPFQTIHCNIQGVSLLKNKQQQQPKNPASSKHTVGHGLQRKC